MPDVHGTRWPWAPNSMAGDTCNPHQWPGFRGAPLWRALARTGVEDHHVVLGEVVLAVVLHLGGLAKRERCPAGMVRPTPSVAAAADRVPSSRRRVRTLKAPVTLEHLNRRGRSGVRSRPMPGSGVARPGGVVCQEPYGNSQVQPWPRPMPSAAQAPRTTKYQPKSGGLGAVVDRDKVEFARL